MKHSPNKYSQSFFLKKKRNDMKNSSNKVTSAPELNVKKLIEIFARIQKKSYKNEIMEHRKSSELGN